LLTIFILISICSRINAQFDILKKVKEKVEQRAEQKTDEAIDKGLDEAEEGVKEGVQGKDEESAEEPNQKKSKKKDVNSDDEENSSEESESKDKTPNFKSYTKYDFVSGDKIILFEDFSQDAVGDFPAKWNTNGSGEVITTNLYPGNWFKITGEGWYMPEPFLELPENFTIQYDLIMQEDENNNSNNFETGIFLYEKNPEVHDEGGAVPGNAGIKIWFEQWGTSWGNYENGSYIMDGSHDINERHFDEIAKISIWGQKQRIRVYLNEEKIFDIPRGLVCKSQI